MFSCVLVARPVKKKSHHEEHEGHEEPEGRPMHSALPVLIFLPFMSFMVHIFSFPGLFGDAAEDQCQSRKNLCLPAFIRGSLFIRFHGWRVP
jgi:hypothetical protein